ncbi:winged helix-turn-helix domain-containing protein [Bordetella bronchialis]|uniref:Cytoplasmic protein n=1 Tax=Bordetella bronchialis TaxID=463025 RepID=A0A193G3M1_9BORD|nr:crosslink repair DNA glycosylase YcaQ family protein [Bordetella bronchialis]ANN73809.1 cytoplasmic protein [Bordetella bronchialis]
MSKPSYVLTPAQARAIWLRAQCLDREEPFGAGPDATRQAVAHLGYVQIDTIHVIERSHHHILHTRIPRYARGDLERAQSVDKSVFEYWTHALSYVPTADYRYYMPAMARHREAPRTAFTAVSPEDYAALLKRIRKEGALSIRDIEEELVEKTHPWDSRKPSKRALRLGFLNGDLAISQRTGMLKRYELAPRHFGWPPRPRPATERQFAQYLLERALRAQGMASLDSICFGNLSMKPAVAELIAARVRRKQLVPTHIDGREQVRHWAEPATLDTVPAPDGAPPRVHILSPFDPLVIQRKRLHAFFGYEHRFEAYVPPDKRVLGYFALPVLVGDRIAAALDLKTDRQAGQLVIKQWTWLAKPRAGVKAAIEEALARFERFQLG